jgi:hypothetical protein
MKTGMEIDRSRFLLLAAAISSGTAAVVGGCKVDRPADSAANTTPAASTTPETPHGDPCVEVDERVAAMLPCGEGYAMSADPRRYCKRFEKSFVPAVSARAARCLTELGRDQVCGYDRCSAFECGLAALRKAGKDPSVAALCAPTIECGEATVEECETYLPGMNEAARNAVVSCLRTRCDLYTCLGYAGYYGNCSSGEGGY